MIDSYQPGEEDESVLLFRQGVPEAFKVFFFQYFPDLFTFAQSIVHKPVLAHKVSIDAFFLCWQRREDLTSDEKIRAFLYLAVRNNCMDHLRSLANPDNGGKEIMPDPPPDSLPPYILRDIYAFAAVGLSKR